MTAQDIIETLSLILLGWSIYGTVLHIIRKAKTHERLKRYYRDDDEGN